MKTLPSWGRLSGQVFAFCADCQYRQEGIMKVSDFPGVCPACRSIKTRLGVHIIPNDCDNCRHTAGLAMKTLIEKDPHIPYPNCGTQKTKEED